ncbi:hypothetical protein [Phenylobacterium parvum]|uniref:Uncharacterized protein n=1 Tax=Phenylobacterium parvum TaxID=2201350 RepID=A0A2Z3HYM7_9CAUL|nr:hypothetical protein [Phenylobacterium parvum]AWM78210.1 hypothetical protein HYN04_10865 [Phenylobacterium parvum]
MALTLDEEQKLEAAGLIAFFLTSQATWLATVKRTHAFLKATLPSGTTIRPDDLAKTLLPLVEVDEPLQAQLAMKKLKPKYWFRYFTNLIIDRLWTQIEEDGDVANGNSSRG